MTLLSPVLSENGTVGVKNRVWLHMEADVRSGTISN